MSKATNKIVRGELAENVDRKQLTPTEWVAIGKAVEKILGVKARERQGWKAPSVKFTEGEKGEAREKVAKSVGISGRTYEKAVEVVEAAAAANKNTACRATRARRALLF